MKRSVYCFAENIRNGFVWLFLMVLVCAGIAGCNGGNGSTTPTSSTSPASKSVFPSTLAVASPLDMTGADEPAPKAKSKDAPELSTDSKYHVMTEAITDILSGKSISACTFNPDLFFRNVTNAACYGPKVPYTNHPDGATPNSGELPPGDVGIWLATDPVTGNACAAAQLNARMQGVQARVLGALSGLAAMVCTINSSGGTLSLPDASNPSVDLTSSMPKPAGVMLNSAVLAYGKTSGGEDKYSYTLDFNYGADHVIVELVHIPGSGASGVFRGQLTYRISTVTNGGNCPMVSGHTPVTRNGSLVYNSESLTAMLVEMREGQFCGSDVNGLDADGIVDATMKYDPISEPHGWGDDFNLFRADFDPTTQLGDYAYSWQAGFHDGNTRVFNLKVTGSGNDVVDDLGATAFFGFGNDASNTDPSILGFIFNWAGPGKNHNIKEYAQKQTVSYNTTTGKFDSVSALISYAPTTSGQYDGTKTFTFDSNADGTVDTNPAVAIIINLATSTDDGTGTFTIEKTIKDAGIVVPTQPVCLK